MKVGMTNDEVSDWIHSSLKAFRGLWFNWNDSTVRIGYGC